MEAKITKLEEQFVSDAAKNPYKKSNLFAGISIFVNGLTNPSSDELKRLMMSNGGVYHTYQRSTTSYIIASNLPDVKIRQGSSCLIIRPDWIIDCLKQQKILDYSKYLLYTERKTNQPKIDFKSLSKQNESSVSNEQIVQTIADANKERSIISKDSQGDLTFLNRKLSETGIMDSLMSGTVDTTTTVTATNRNQSKTANDPNFLAEFYKNSRLHHISTLGAGFKYLISELRSTHNGQFPKRQPLIEKFQWADGLPPLKANDTPSIMHIDMDCFFVSVGLRNRSHLRSQPVAVTHSKGSQAGPMSSSNLNRQKEIELYAKRLNDKHGDSTLSASIFGSSIGAGDSLSEIASCSYEARQMGIKNGMMVGAALKLCPNLKTIPYDFDEYKEVADTLYGIIAKYTLDIEAVSCDEMYVDLTSLCQSTGVPVMDFVRLVRNEIQATTKCPCSAGVGANRQVSLTNCICVCISFEK